MIDELSNIANWKVKTNNHALGSLTKYISISFFLFFSELR